MFWTLPDPKIRLIRTFSNAASRPLAVCRGQEQQRIARNCKRRHGEVHHGEGLLRTRIASSITGLVQVLVPPVVAGDQQLSAVTAFEISLV